MPTCRPAAFAVRGAESVMNILLDLDGTLTDPREGITRCIQHALRKMGRKVPDANALVHYIGPPLQQSFREMLDGDEAGARRALALYRERFADTGLYENAVYPGIEYALDRLIGRGARLMVATSKPTVYARHIVNHFGLNTRVEKVWGSELDGRRTDKRELLAHVLERTGIRVEETLMVGDRRHDATGAIRNGIRPIGVAWGYGSKAELYEAGVEHILDHPEQLAGISMPSERRDYRSHAPTMTRFAAPPRKT